MALSRFQTLEADEVTFATDMEGIFAGGDAQTGPGVAIGAVAAGRQAAISISRYLKGEDLRAGREPLELQQENFLPIPDDLQPSPRAEMPLLTPSERKKDFAEVESVLTEEQARAEAERCLNCMSCSECLQCVTACKAEAVTLETHAQREQTTSLDVGSVILTAGFEPFDPGRFDNYGYSAYSNVITSMEFERILSATGPYEGHVKRPSDGREPKKIAWLQCVGSRDMNRCDNGYCSSVCCMYAIKEAMIAKDISAAILSPQSFIWI